MGNNYCLKRRISIEHIIDFDKTRDSDMVYVIQDGDLIVYDFDGYNRRQLAKNVSSHFPAGITDNKWLYYFSDGQLIREWIVEH